MASSADWNADGDADALGSIKSFDVTNLIPSDWTMEDSEFSTNGYYYVPTVCEDENESCKIVFALHGCFGNSDYVKDGWGLNSFASTNKYIIVYPESTCWDNHGDVDEDDYLTKDGLYPRVFENMVSQMTDPDFVAPGLSVFGYQLASMAAMLAYVIF